MDEQETRSLSESPPMLSYQRSRVATPELCRPWHVFVTLVICWTPVVLVPIRLLVEVSQTKPVSMLGQSEAAIIGMAIAGIAAALAHRAIVLASRSETTILGRLAGLFGTIATLCALPALDKLNRLQAVDWYDGALAAVVGALWFVAGSMWSWGRQLDRVLSR